MSKDFMKIKNQTDSSADLYFYGDIVSDWFGAWQEEDQYPEAIRKFLDGVKDVQSLNIYINSGGGSVFAGLAIYNMLKRHKAYKTVYVDGVAASIASIIAMAGDKVIIPSNAFLMIHKPWSISIGNANDMRKMADDLEAIETGMMNVYREKILDGVNIQTIQDMVDAETWLNGVEAAKYFQVEVGEANQAAASVSDFYDRYKNTPKNLKNLQRPEPEPTPDPEPMPNQGQNAMQKPASASAEDAQREKEHILLDLDLI